MDRYLKATRAQLSGYCVTLDMLCLDRHLCIVMVVCGIAPFLSVEVMCFLFHCYVMNEKFVNECAYSFQLSGLFV
jgi:hypothetical protein